MAHLKTHIQYDKYDRPLKCIIEELEFHDGFDGREWLDFISVKITIMILII